MCEKKTNSNLHLLDGESKHWYIFYTASRAEKKSCENLRKKGYKVYIPLKRALHFYKNRQKKIIEIPIIPGYIFVYTTASQIPYIQRIPRISTCIYIGKEPCCLKDEEMEMLIKITTNQDEIQLDNGSIPGKKVKINKGPLKGYTGTLIKEEKNNRIGVYIKVLNQTISIPLDSNYVIESA